MKKLFITKVILKQFCTKTTQAIKLKDFNLSKQELKDINNQAKAAWVAPGKDKIVI
jgi:hypothetical protein